METTIDEKRRFNRWYVNGIQRAAIASKETREIMNILDISAGGISVVSQCPIAMGTLIHGEFEILPHRGSFFISGHVIRVTEKENYWKIVIAFHKIRTIPV